MTQNFTEIRLEELQAELGHLREIIRQTQAQLVEAESIIRYYGDVHSYSLSPQNGDIVFQDRLLNDGEPASNTNKTRVAGLRARLYLKKYANVSDS